MKKLHTRGFTIIELLIATVAFSAVLLVITGAIIQFSKIYYKGVVTSKTQEVARSIADEMSRAAQFSKTKTPVANNPGIVSATGQAWCFGDKRFNYILGKRFSTSQPVLNADTAPAGSCTYNPASSRELVSENMQLLRLDVTENGDKVSVTVTVAYGASTDINIDTSNPANSSCKTIRLGGQYCAISTVTNIVTRRLGSN